MRALIEAATADPSTGPAHQIVAAAPFRGSRPTRRRATSPGGTRTWRGWWRPCRGVRVLTLFGPSGAGKTSFLRAGLRTAAEHAGWHVVILRTADFLIDKFAELERDLLTNRPRLRTTSEATLRAWLRSAWTSRRCGGPPELPGEAPSTTWCARLDQRASPVGACLAAVARALDRRVEDRRARPCSSGLRVTLTQALASLSERRGRLPPVPGFFAVIATAPVWDAVRETAGGVEIAELLEALSALRQAEARASESHATAIADELRRDRVNALGLPETQAALVEALVALFEVEPDADTQRDSRLEAAFKAIAAPPPEAMEPLVHLSRRLDGYLRVLAARRALRAGAEPWLPLELAVSVD